MTFRFASVRDTVAAVHARDVDDATVRQVWFIDPLDRAIVLGSTQPVAMLEPEAVRESGLNVVRRRSGGGAVLVDADQLSWFDVFIPIDDPLFEADVSRSSLWLGETICSALRSLGLDAAVASNTPNHRRDAALVCFAGTTAGEVLVAGRKAVGISQRRTRSGARFQAMVLRAFDPELMAGLFAIEGAGKAQLAEHLHAVVQAVRVNVDDLREALEAAFTQR